MSTPPSVGELTGYLQVLASLTSNICKLGLPAMDDDSEDDLMEGDFQKSETDAVSFKEELEVNFYFIYF